MGDHSGPSDERGTSLFERLNRVLEEAGFDAIVEGLCAVFYASRLAGASSFVSVLYLQHQPNTLSKLPLEALFDEHGPDEQGYS